MRCAPAHTLARTLLQIPDMTTERSDPLAMLLLITLWTTLGLGLIMVMVVVLMH